MFKIIFKCMRMNSFFKQFQAESVSDLFVITNKKANRTLKIIIIVTIISQTQLVWQRK